MPYARDVSIGVPQLRFPIDGQKVLATDIPVMHNLNDRNMIQVVREQTGGSMENERYAIKTMDSLKIM